MRNKVTIGVVCSRGIGPDRGGRAANEDNYLVCRNGQIRFLENDDEKVVGADGAGILLAVADGMGGHDHGALASAAAVQATSLLFRRGIPGDVETTLHGFVLQAHRRLRAKAVERGADNMGTTLTVAWLVGAKAYWAHVGDSRLYHMRGEALHLMTRDHTRGEFARRDARHPPRDPGYLAQNFIFGSRGLGDDEGIRIDAGTDTGVLELKKGDRLILTTDGVSAFVEDHRIRDAVREAPEPAACATWLLERAMAAGSNDNITAVVARIDDIDGTRSYPTEETYNLWESDPLGTPFR